MQGVLVYLMDATYKHSELKNEIYYPKVLICALSRINKYDMFNNSLLLRSLFADWPRARLAQIYSGGSNSDEGFCGQQYQIAAYDRRLGKLFFRLKGSYADIASTSFDAESGSLLPKNRSFIKRVRFAVGKFIMSSGLYEIIFRIKPSKQLYCWANEFAPDIIFAQGYNLSFVWLPLFLKKTTGAKLAFLTSDDWPTYLYSGKLGEPTLFRWFVRLAVKNAIHRLFSEVDVPFAFGQSMSEEYASRYGKKFIILNHADNPERFDSATAVRIHSLDIVTIMAIGNYNQYRWPLLIDANDACSALHDLGIDARIVVLSSSIEPAGAKALSAAPFVDIMPDPGNDMLPSYLKGADILLLAEGFDAGFVSAIKLSISSKAHLFMFSHRPIIVYAHPDTGVSRYAQRFGWGKLVKHRNKRELIETIQEIIENKNETDRLVAIADKVVNKFHSHKANRDILLRSLTAFKANRN